MTTTSVFTESDHPRYDDGRFSQKHHAEAAGGLGTLRTPNDADPFSDDHQLPTGELLDALHTACREIMDDHGLEDWTLAYDGSRGDTVGMTDHARKAIVLSAANMVALPGEQRRDTILHEVAHALLDAHEDHGPHWQRKAHELGAVPRASSRAVGSKAAVSAVTGTCPLGHTIGKGRMPAVIDRNRYYCVDSRHPSDQPYDERRYTWTRNELDPEVAAAVKRHPAPRQGATHQEGAVVRVVFDGSKWDGMTGTVISVGRTNYVVRLDATGTNLRAPFEAFESQDQR